MYLTSSKSSFKKNKKSNNEYSIFLQLSRNFNSTNFQTFFFFVIQIFDVIYIFQIFSQIFTFNVYFLITKFKNANFEKIQIRKLISFLTIQNFRIDNIEWTKFLKFFHQKNIYHFDVHNIMYDDETIKSKIKNQRNFQNVFFEQ